MSWEAAVAVGEVEAVLVALPAKEGLDWAAGSG